MDQHEDCLQYTFLSSLTSTHWAFNTFFNLYLTRKFLEINVSFSRDTWPKQYTSYSKTTTNTNNWENEKTNMYVFVCSYMTETFTFIEGPINLHLSSWVAALKCKQMTDVLWGSSERFTIPLKLPADDHRKVSSNSDATLKHANKDKDLSSCCTDGTIPFSRDVVSCLLHSSRITRGSVFLTCRSA